MSKKSRKKPCIFFKFPGSDIFRIIKMKVKTMKMKEVNEETRFLKKNNLMRA